MTSMTAHTREHDELRSYLRGFLAQHSIPPQTRQQRELTDEYDPQMWRRMATELGLQGLAIPEHHNGSGGAARKQWWSRIKSFGLSTLGRS